MKRDRALEALRERWRHPGVGILQAAKDKDRIDGGGIGRHAGRIFAVTGSVYCVKAKRSDELASDMPHHDVAEIFCLARSLQDRRTARRGPSRQALDKSGPRYRQCPDPRLRIQHELRAPEQGNRLAGVGVRHQRIPRLRALENSSSTFTVALCRVDPADGVSALMLPILVAETVRVKFNAPGCWQQIELSGSVANELSALPGRESGRGRALEPHAGGWVQLMGQDDRLEPECRVGLRCQRPARRRCSARSDRVSRQLQEARIPATTPRSRFSCNCVSASRAPVPASAACVRASSSRAPASSCRVSKSASSSTAVKLPQTRKSRQSVSTLREIGRLVDRARPRRAARGAPPARSPAPGRPPRARSAGIDALCRSAGRTNAAERRPQPGPVRRPGDAEGRRRRRRSSRSPSVEEGVVGDEDRRQAAQRPQPRERVGAPDAEPLREPGCRPDARASGRRPAGSSSRRRRRARRRAPRAPRARAAAAGRCAGPSRRRARRRRSPAGPAPPAPRAAAPAPARAPTPRGAGPRCPRCSGARPSARSCSAQMSSRSQ